MDFLVEKQGLGTALEPAEVVRCPVRRVEEQTLGIGRSGMLGVGDHQK